MVGKEEEVAFLTREGSEKMNLPYTASFEGKDNVDSIGLGYSPNKKRHGAQLQWPHHSYEQQENSQLSRLPFI